MNMFIQITQHITRIDMEKNFKIIFTGELLSGFQRETVIESLIGLTNMDREKAEKLLAAERPTLIKKDIDMATAEKYRHRFEKAGLQIRLEQTAPLPVKTPTPPKTSMIPTAAPAKTPVQPEKKPEEPQKEPVNPYVPPKADLKILKEEIGDWLDEPKKVPPSHGWLWIKSAFSMFFSHPFKWTIIIVLSVAIGYLVGLIPKAGSTLNTLYGTVITGGIMMVAYEQYDTGKLRIELLFGGFGERRRHLVYAGLINFLFSGVAAIIMVAVFTTEIGGIKNEIPPKTRFIEYMLLHHASQLFLIFLIALILFAPLTMAYLFTPALVTLNDQKAWAAYKLSFRSCLKNISAFLLYCLICAVFCVVVVTAYVLLHILVVQFIGGSTLLLHKIMPITFIVVIGVPTLGIFWLSIFSGFKDLYYQTY